MSMYDIAIIGAGVSGASIAWQLSHYDLQTILLESEADVCFGVSKANSGIVHGGFHHALKTLKAKLEIRGSLMFERLQHDLGFPFQRCGILVVALRDEDMSVVRRLFEQGRANGVQGLEVCGRERILSLEPGLNPEVVGGLYAPNGGTVEPYRYVFSLVESAIRNGVNLRCNCRIRRGIHESGAWTLLADDGTEIRARHVVNAAGLHADEVSRCCGAEEYEIHPRKGEEYLLDRRAACRPRHVIFPVPSPHSKGMLVIPTAGGTTMIGPTADTVPEKGDTVTTTAAMDTIFEQAGHLVQGVSRRDLIASFAGNRPVLDSEDFFIATSEKVPHFIHVAGIQSPGLTASPAIGEYVKDLLKGDGVQMIEKAVFEYDLPRRRSARDLSFAELDALHAEDPSWTRIICRCERVSEAEIVEAVRHGHTTLDGVKFYTRAGMGRCQGGFCSARILKIISRESGIPLEELTKKGGNSRILVGKLGDLEVRGEGLEVKGER